MTKPKGRRQPLPAGAPARTPTALQTAVAADLANERRRHAQQQQAATAQGGGTLEQRTAEAAAAVAASEALLAATAATSAAFAENGTASNARERELCRKPSGVGQDVRAAMAAEQWRLLRPKSGQLLDESQSRAILLLYFHLVEMGKRPEKAVDKVAAAFGVSKGKIYAVRTQWERDNSLMTTSAKGRGAVSGEDRRQILNKERRANLIKYMAEQHDIGRPVSRRTVAEWVQAVTGREMSDLSAGRMLSRLGYKRRGGTYVLL